MVINKKNNMKLDEKKKTQYTRIALALCGVAVNDMTAELVWKVVKGVEEKKGNFSISDTVELEHQIEAKYAPKKEIVAVPKDNRKPLVDYSYSEDDRNQLPTISVGGRPIELAKSQKKTLNEKILKHGQNSIEVSVYMMEIVSNSRCVKDKDGSFKQENLIKK